MLISEKYNNIIIPWLGTRARKAEPYCLPHLILRAYKRNKKMGKLIDLTGKKFGRLVVIKRVENHISPDGSVFAQWLCECDCGNSVVVFSRNLRNGNTKSCGCYFTEKLKKRLTKHGFRYSKLYYIWIAIKARCYNKKNIGYKNYGGRGIKVCDEWLDIENGSTNFINWALKNGYKEGLTIDRIDVNGDYSPENCRWTSRKEQSNNKRNNHYITINGEIKTLSQWFEIYKISKTQFYYRKRRGMNEIEALTTPNMNIKNI